MAKDIEIDPSTSDVYVTPKDIFLAKVFTAGAALVDSETRARLDLIVEKDNTQKLIHGTGEDHK